jgi:hypothetical protein
MSILMLPEPASWRDSRKTLRWVVLGVLAMVALMLYWGIPATLRGHYLTTVVILGWAAFPLAVVVALVFASYGRTSLRVSYDSTGTKVLPDRTFSILGFTGLAAVIPAGVLFVIFVPRGDIDIPMSRGLQIFSPILMGSAVVVAIVGLINAWRRGGMGYLKLTRTGIDNANVAFTKSIAWDDIADITDSAETKRTRKAIVLCLQDGSEEVIEGADLYVPRGAALYWMVRHYWLRPDDRSELTDGRAVDRLRDGRFELD